jgi:hypothetical protein
MILPDFVLPTRANAQWDTSGIDTLELCLDSRHFKKYPYPVQYSYNSRGYRDQEWPQDLEQLRSAIWCVGDSFTVGLGSPLVHTWPQVLQQHTGRRCINVSLDGASNDWISRKACAILDTIAPENLVIHWSYWHRREAPAQELRNYLVQQVWADFYNGVKDPSWPACDTFEQIELLPEHIKQEIKQHWIEPEVCDEDLFFFSIDERRRSNSFVVDDDENLKNIKKCIHNTITSNKNTNIIHSFIPEFVEHDLYQKKNVPEAKYKQLVDGLDQGINLVPYFSKLDLARDGHHYDIRTAEYFVQQLLARL